MQSEEKPLTHALVSPQINDFYEVLQSFCLQVEKWLHK